MLTGGSVYGGAWVITGLGVAMHNLPLVYLGNRESAFFNWLSWRFCSKVEVQTTNIFSNALRITHFDWNDLVSVLVGVGYGCAYTPPIQALIEWFPDRRGLASGIVISGFGSGALFYAPLMNLFTQKFSTMPTYLGNQVGIKVYSHKQDGSQITDWVKTFQRQFKAQ